MHILYFLFIILIAAVGVYFIRMVDDNKGAIKNMLYVALAILVFILILQGFGVWSEFKTMRFDP